ncbi:MAG: 5-(carboxyamino)imidazole ribonucleotide synthase [Pseudomonadota bacterium]|jgi:phosphoribosylaminoimidazole carboxylase, PurK protein|nr:MAG: 5-(carboxyamino)imidazole ribonucleotide synthase [Pseudomonadota bacterium]
MTVGIVGAGQLGRMLALAGYPLGLDFLFLDRSEDTPGGQVAPILCGEFTDRRLLRRLAQRCSVITFDWENVSVEALRGLDSGTRIHPPVGALAASQDRAAEKRLFERLRIPTTRWMKVDSRPQLERAVREIGLPAVLKTRRMGYDGKGQAVIRTHEDVDRAWSELGGVPLICEEWVPFDCEVSIIGARSRSGEVAVYPLNGNVHAQGILRLTRAPFGTPRLQRAAAGYLTRVLEHFRYVGVLTIEFFVRSGKLLANEMAPRVHNSGHWTIEGAVTSQFENHLRAILDLPLGSTAPRGHCAMINLIGTMPARERVLARPGVHLHDYGKEPRPGRKLGHCTVVEVTPRARDRRARELLADLAPEIRIP